MRSHVSGVIGGSKCLGKIVYVSVDKLKPITYETVHRIYYDLGKQVGTACHGGTKLK